VHAEFHELPPSLVPVVLSETVPAAFNPTPFEAADFAVEWIGPALPGVSVSLGERSLEWVRVADVVVLPRARLVVSAQGIRNGLVTNAGFSQPFQMRGQEGYAAIPVALISGDQNPVEITLDNARKGKLRFVFKPRKAEAASQIAFDTSCSPWRVKATEIKFTNPNQWIYVGCRLVHVQGEKYPTTSLEMFVYWDGAGNTLKVNGNNISESSDGIWPLRVRSGGPVTLTSAGGSVSIAYGIPERDRYAFLGLGIGPYTYKFETTKGTINSVIPLTTIYASYFITEYFRLVAFDATAIYNQWYTDFGLYMYTMSLRTLDNRLTMSLLLGAHTLVFPANGQTYVRPSAPQGIEFIYRDAFKKAHNISLGAFLYPQISGRSYSNIWLRWGSSSLFVELNYLSWREKIGVPDEEPVYTKSVGISVGIPIARFL
jgi:hypothetical protein